MHQYAACTWWSRLYAPANSSATCKKRWPIPRYCASRLLTQAPWKVPMYDGSKAECHREYVQGSI